MVVVRLPVFRAFLDGPPVADGRLPVDELNRLARPLQGTLQAIAEQVAESESRGLAVSRVRRSCRLSIAELLPGSVVISFDFALQLAADELEVVRARAVEELIEGVGELSEHTYLPRAWSPRALKSLRDLARAGEGLDDFILEAPRYVPDRLVRLGPELAPRLSTMIDRYQRGVESTRARIGTLPPQKRRKKPRFPLFDSGHPEFGDEIGRAFGSDEGEN
jgi:hypothetical protein